MTIDSDSICMLKGIDSDSICRLMGIDSDSVCMLMRMDSDSECMLMKMDPFIYGRAGDERLCYCERVCVADMTL